MQRQQAQTNRVAAIPDWVPTAARSYIAHTETGLPIRVLARWSGCHASTILRQIRRYEARRDDRLVDEALSRIGQSLTAKPVAHPASKETEMTSQNQTLSDTRLTRESLRILPRLCETGAVLAVAPDMDKAVVVRDSPQNAPIRSAVVDRDIAQAMALKDWIICDTPGRVSRYRITGAGRAALSRMMAEAENVATGFAEAPMAFRGKPLGEEDESPRRARYGVVEAPLTLLARRREKSGARFLSDDLVRAGERLREDFELAQMAPRTDQSWDSYVIGDLPQGTTPSATGPDAARRRVADALRDLGPGLGDVALRCCCYLEGLEMAEKRMGWSARSGKIVLRIALQRLKRHYDMLGPDSGLIG